MQDWAQIRYLRGSEGLSIRAIAARLGLSRDTVSRAVASSSPCQARCGLRFPRATVPVGSGQSGCLRVPAMNRRSSARPHAAPSLKTLQDEQK